MRVHRKEPFEKTKLYNSHELINLEKFVKAYEFLENGKDADPNDEFTTNPVELRNIVHSCIRGFMGAFADDVCNIYQDGTNHPVLRSALLLSLHIILCHLDPLFAIFEEIPARNETQEQGQEIDWWGQKRTYKQEQQQGEFLF